MNHEKTFKNSVKTFRKFYSRELLIRNKRVKGIILTDTKSQFFLSESAEILEK